MHDVLFHPRHEVRRPLQIKRERDELRQIVLRIPALVRLIPVAHGSQRRLRLFGEAQIPLHLGAHVEPLRIGDVQINVVPARVHRRQDGKQSLVRIERDGSRICNLRQRLVWSLFRDLGDLFLSLA